MICEWSDQKPDGMSSIHCCLAYSLKYDTHCHTVTPGTILCKQRFHLKIHILEVNLSNFVFITHDIIVTFQVTLNPSSFWLKKKVGGGGDETNEYFKLG